MIPLWLLGCLAVNWPLADLGLTAREPTENDGMAPWPVIIVPVVAVYSLIWWSVNRPFARRTSLSARNYWLLSTSGTLLPMTALIASSF